MLTGVKNTICFTKRVFIQKQQLMFIRECTIADAKKLWWMSLYSFNTCIQCVLTEYMRKSCTMYIGCCFRLRLLWRQLNTSMHFVTPSNIILKFKSGCQRHNFMIRRKSILWLFFEIKSGSGKSVNWPDDCIIVTKKNLLYGIWGLHEVGKSRSAHWNRIRTFWGIHPIIVHFSASNFYTDMLFM